MQCNEFFETNLNIIGKVNTQNFVIAIAICPDEQKVYTDFKGSSQDYRRGFH